MPFDGSGNFNRTDGSRTGATVWQGARDAGVKVVASGHDTHDEDIASGLENCVCKDGQNTATANLPMGGFKHTNVATASARTDYARASQVQDSSLTYAGSSGGSSNAYTLTMSPAITAYANGQRFFFLANHSNTGAATLNVNGVGAIAIKKGTGSTALTSGDIIQDQLYEVVYNSGGGGYFLVIASGNSSLTNLTVSSLTASQPVLTDSSKSLITQSASTFRSTIGAAASGANSDITALTGIGIQSWTPSYSCSGSMSISSITTDEAEWVRIGPYIFFHIAFRFTLGGTASSNINITHPTAGQAHAANAGFICLGVENSTVISGGARWRYTGSAITVFKYSAANWTLGSGGEIAIEGKYRI